MKLLRFDPVGGASGDMVLAALADAGADMAAVRRGVASLGAGRIVIRAAKVVRDGFRGAEVSVGIPRTHGHHHHHRNLREIKRLIARSSITPAAKRTSMAVFDRLALAEAAVHGTTAGRIHFHEVGAFDSIADIVGGCIALESLGVDAVATAPLPLGHGTVGMAHGILPVPAPAVVELLKGRPVVDADEPFELVTPTGAALITTWCDLFPAKNREPAGTISGCGCGFGRRRLNTRPNMLRALIIETAGDAGVLTDTCLVLECNLDDMTPELIGSTAATLLDNGALDVFTVSAQMKKQRPGAILTVICRPSDRDTMLDLIFRGTTTFGIREQLAARTVLDRRVEPAATPFGRVRIKIGAWRGRDITFSPEHGDCVALAGRNNTTARAVYEAAVAAAGRARKRK